MSNGFSGMMSPEARAIARQYQAQYPGEMSPWLMSIGARRTGQHDYPAKHLADAEHYLWARHNAAKGLPQAALGLALPFGYSAYKSIGQLFGRDPGSIPDLEQLWAGQTGANEGFMQQLRGLWR